MEEKIAKSPKFLTKAAGNHSCCIFRVPHSFVEHNRKAYHPQIVSIGPYHRGKSGPRMVQEHKWRYLGSLLSRTQTKGIGSEDLMKAIAPLESQARECYSETTIHLNSHEFLEMMLLDGSFVIELFRKFNKFLHSEEPVDDPLLTMRWIRLFFQRDFLMLENQIPFFILQRLFDRTKEEESNTDLSLLAIEFLRQEDITDINIQSNMDDAKHLLDLVRSSYMPSQPQESDPKETKTQEPNEATTTIQSNMNAKHLLDLVRSCFILCHQPQGKNKPPRTPMIHCISKLRRAGIRITPGKDGDSFLNVTFSNGDIEMPIITVDDFMMYFLPNCVAFEQCCRRCSDHFTSYTTLLDCLISSWRDVEYLCEKKIIQNYLGSEREVANFVNKMGKDVALI